MTNRYTIAVTGKGGTGKTTIAGAIITCLIRKGLGPVLAVDADPNSCLDQVLGVKVQRTVGRIREESRDAAANQPSGISKRELLELRISESLVESDGFDLIAMGRPEGPGCYCYANNLFSDVINRLSDSYPYIIIDNEAGLENLSRRLYKSVNLLIIAGDPSKRGIETIKRLLELAKEMGIVYGKLAVVVNLLRNNTVPDAAETLMKETGADHSLMLEYDTELAVSGEAGRSLLGLTENNPFLVKISNFIDDLHMQGEANHG